MTPLLPLSSHPIILITSGFTCAPTPPTPPALPPSHVSDSKWLHHKSCTPVCNPTSHRSASTLTCSHHDSLQYFATQRSCLRPLPREDATRHSVSSCVYQIAMMISSYYTHTDPSCLISGTSSSFIPCTVPIPNSYRPCTKSSISLCVILLPTVVHPRSPSATMTASSILPPTDDASDLIPGRTQQSIPFHPVGTIPTRISLDQTHAVLSFLIPGTLFQPWPLWGKPSSTPWIWIQCHTRTLPVSSIQGGART